MWLIGSKENIEAYISKVDNYNGYKGDKTATWAEPRKHPDKNLYTVMKNPSVPPDTELTQKETLPDDWSPDKKTTL
jgi:hypothetical protein